MRELREMPRPTLELGLAGYGQLARKYYAPALRGLHGVTLSTVVDPLEASREAARAAFPGIASGATPDVLFNRRLDGIIVAGPPSTHLELWNLAAGAGVPVLLEKPFVLRGQLGQAASGERERELLMLDLNRRFWPPYCRIRDAARAGLVGDLQLLEIHLHVDIRPWCRVTSHRLQMEEGGVLYDLGSQAIDLARWIAGAEVQDVSAWSESRRWKRDHVVLELRLVGGIRARCDLAYSERPAERIVVRGSAGELRLFNPNMAVHFGRPNTVGRSPLGYARDFSVLCYRGLRRSQSMVRYTVAAALARFIDSIRRGLPFSPGFDDAAANTRWLDAADRALDLGVQVTQVDTTNMSSARG